MDDKLCSVIRVLPITLCALGVSFSLTMLLMGQREIYRKSTGWPYGINVKTTARFQNRAGSEKQKVIRDPGPFSLFCFSQETGNVFLFPYRLAFPVSLISWGNRLPYCSFVHNHSMHQKRRVGHLLVAVSGVPDEVCLVQLQSGVHG